MAKQDSELLKGTISAPEEDVYAGLPSDSEPILQEDWDNMGGDYCITVPETIYVDTGFDPDLVTLDNAAFDIDPNWLSPTNMFDNDIEINHKDESVRVAETLVEQKLQIEALTDMIGEMVKTKNFDIDWDLERRVEQKRFLNKLGGK